MKRNPANERIKHRYFSHLKGPLQLDEQSVDSVAAALHRFEKHNGWRDFKKFRPEQADSFQSVLLKQRNARTGTPLSKGSLVSILRALKKFFFWLAGQPGYKSKLHHDWADHFNPPLKGDRGGAGAPRAPRAYSETNPRHYRGDANRHTRRNAEPCGRCLHYPHWLAR